MPVARGASSPGRGSGRALGWACRVMWCGVAVPASCPPDRTDSTVRSNGSKTSSTRRPARRRVDLVAVAVHGHGRGLGDGPPFGPAERLGQVRGGGDGERAAGFPPGQRRLPGLGMRPGVVDRLGPRGEQPVQLRQVRDLGGAGLGQLGQELAADGAEEPLDLPPALGPSGLAVHQLDAQPGAGPQQPRVDERRAVVHVDVLGDAAGGQRRAQRGGQPDGVLGEPEPGGHHRPGMIIEEREQVGLAAVHPDRVQRVPGPDLVRPVTPRTGRTPARPRR